MSRHVYWIAVATIRHALRSASGVSFVVLSALIGLFTCATMLQAWESAARLSVALERHAHEAPKLDRDKLIKKGTEAFSRIIEPVLGGLTEKSASPEEKAARQAQNRRQIDFITKEQPTLLAGFALLLLYFLPFFVASGAFNQLSGDVQSNALRFQLPRTTRANIYFGRFAGTTLFVATVMLLLAATVFLYVYGIGVYPLEDLLRCSVRTALAFVLLTPPYVALCLMISACIDSPIGSLVASKGIVLAFPGLVLVVQMTWDPLGYLGYMLPYPFHHWFFHPDDSRFAWAALASLAYTVVYLGAGYAYFRKRDL